nr:molybdopterin-binding protein [Sphingopyxis sp. BSNA05]
MVALAACDVREAKIWKRARLSVIATGKELVPPGEASITPNSIPDSLSEALLLLGRQWGAIPMASVRVDDDLSIVEAQARIAIANSDIVAVIGGASAGKRDYAKKAFRKAGTQLIWEGVSMKPGKPVWMGKSGSTFVLGLPGNPTAAITTARLFLVPLLKILGGTHKSNALCWSEIPLAEDFEYNSDRLAFLSAIFRDGKVSIEKDQRSSGQIRLLTSDGLVRVEPGSGLITEGTGVPFLAW